MNLRRYLLATFALFAFIFICDIFVHGVVLKGMYEATANVWRDFAEMEALMPLSMCFQLALSAWITFGFSQFYKDGGIKNGLRYGLFFGVLAGILTASWYLLLNVPATLGLSWLISSIVEGLGGGFVLGLIYRK